MVLRPGASGSPFIMAKIGVGRARGDDEVIVRKLEAVHFNDALFEIEAQHLSQQDLDILVPGENVADRGGILGLGRCRRSPPDTAAAGRGDGSLRSRAADLNRQTGQRLGSLQAAKPPPIDDDPRTCVLIHGHTL